MWIGPYVVKVGRVIDVSLYGMRIGTPNRVPSAFRKRGKRYRVEVRVDGRWQLRRLVEVRNVGGSGIGLKIRRAVPRRLLIVLLLILGASLARALPVGMPVDTPAPHAADHARRPLPAVRHGNDDTVVLSDLFSRRP